MNKLILTLTLTFVALCTNAQSWNDKTRDAAYEAPNSLFCKKWIDSKKNITYLFSTNGIFKVSTTQVIDNASGLVGTTEMSGNFVRNKDVLTLTYSSVKCSANPSDLAKLSARMRDEISSGLRQLSIKGTNEMRNQKHYMLLLRLDDEYLIWAPYDPKTKMFNDLKSDVLYNETHEKKRLAREKEEKEKKLAIIDNLVKNMVRVEGGTFTMGATPEQGSDAKDNEKPTHQVTLSSFYIGKYEVTQEEWQAVMGYNPSDFKGAKLPVEDMTWNSCQEFIGKLNALTGKNFRLPTEAEWEFAARGGNISRGYKYAGSNDIDSVAWYGRNSGSRTHDVGQKQPNELGLYDMSGNVCEWCSDTDGDYSSEAQTNPQGPVPRTGREQRMCRGGYMLGFAEYCRVSWRFGDLPGISSPSCGLRLAY